MAGFANAIAGAGQQAGQLGSQVRAQNFQHQENALKQVQEQYNNLADALERTKAQYAAAPDIVNRLNDVEMQIRAAHMPGQPVDAQSYQKLLGQYLKAKQEANQAWAVHPSNPANRVIGTPAVQNAVAQATGQAGVQPVGPTPTPPPFAPQIAQPSGPPAAQPSTSPVQPATQGGGSSSGATFPTAPVPPAASAAVEPVAPDTSVPPLTASTGGASVAPVVPLDDLLARSMAGYQDTGIMSPQLNAALGHQMGTQAALEQLYRTGGINLQLAKQKLSALEETGALKDLPPTLRTMIQAGAYGINMPGIANLAKPMNVPGLLQTSALPPGSKDAYGNPIDPSTTPYVRVQRSLLGGPDMYYPEQGGVSRVIVPDQDSATGFSQVIVDHSGNETGRIQGVPPPANLTEHTSVQSSAGSPDITTIRKPVVPGLNAPPVNAAPGQRPPATPAGGGVPPVGGSSVKPTAGKFNTTLDQTARDVVNGVQAMPGDSRTANAVRDSARRQGLSIPPVYPPAVQDALAKNVTALDQINQVLGILEPVKNDNKPLHSLWDRVLYGAGIESPDEASQAIGKISVTDILSAGRVLSSAGIRSNRFNYNDAMTHTPNLYKDSGKLAYDKLVWMKQLIEDQNKNALQYQRKSGVIPVGGEGQATSAGKAPTNAQEYLQSIGH